jgi:hypothetical protein
MDDDAIASDQILTSLSFISYLTVETAFSEVLTNEPAKFMEQNPWEANSISASQETPRILWNVKVHCRVHKSPPPPLVRIHAHPTDVFKTQSNIFLPSMFMSLSFRFPNQNSTCTSAHLHMMKYRQRHRIKPRKEITALQRNPSSCEGRYSRHL